MSPSSLYCSYLNDNSSSRAKSYIPSLASNRQVIITKIQKPLPLHLSQEGCNVHSILAYNMKYDNDDKSEEEDGDEDYEMGPHLLSRDESDDDGDSCDNCSGNTEFGENCKNNYFDIFRDTKYYNLASVSSLTDDDFSAATNIKTISRVYSTSSNFPQSNKTTSRNNDTYRSIFRSSSNNRCDNVVGISYPIAAMETSESRATYLATQRQRRYSDTASTTMNMQIEQTVIKPGLPINVLWQDQECRQDGSSICISHDIKASLIDNDENDTMDSTILTTNYDNAIIAKNSFKPINSDGKDGEDGEDSDDAEISKANNQMVCPLCDIGIIQVEASSDLCNNSTNLKKKQVHHPYPPAHSDNAASGIGQIIPCMQSSFTGLSLSKQEDGNTTNNTNNMMHKLNHRHQCSSKHKRKELSGLTSMSLLSSLHRNTVETKCECVIM